MKKETEIRELNAEEVDDVSGGLEINLKLGSDVVEWFSFAAEKAKEIGIL